MRKVWGITIAACLAAAPAWAFERRPVVLELFTSEGCSSCPPADQLLTDLDHGQPGVLALAFHITYWDRLGWPDPFALPAATKRQEEYASKLGLDTIYTPQLIVDGRQDVVGSDEPSVRSAVRHAAPAASDAVRVTLARSAGGVTVEVGPGAAASATVLIAGFDGKHVTTVKHGENAGRTLAETNIVRGLVRAGEWRGAAVSLHAPLPPGE